jgi:hypothetical protein
MNANAVAALGLSLLVCVGCKKAPHETEVASAAPSERPPVDHLSPGELAAGKQAVFGFALPEGLRLIGVFPGVAEASGPLTMEDVSNYIRAHVDQQRVELGAVGAVFPAVHINGGDPARLFRFQLSMVGNDTHLSILDVTPKPPQPVEHISNEEAWRRAGFKPDGTPIDKAKFH